MSIITSKARRPKNNWFLYSSKVCDKYQINIGYKTSLNRVGAFSSSAQSDPVKVPWGPHTKCQLVVKSSGDEVIREYKFYNRSHQSASFDEVILNMMIGGVSPFSQRVTSMCVQNKKVLLTKYLDIVQFSSEFVHHRELIHDDDGFMIDGSGSSVKDLEDNGGSLIDYRDFVKVVKESSHDIAKTKNIYEDMARNRADGRKRKKAPAGGEPAKKKTKSAVLDQNEKTELMDSTGLEQQYKSSFIGVASIPLDNLKVPEELQNLVNIYRVFKIKASMKARFDPSQIVFVVSPVDDSKPPVLKEVGSQKFLVVQKIHSFSAMIELDKKDELSTLCGLKTRKVLCYVLNTNSSALLHYGNCRSNEISNKFNRKTYPQDLLHVFENLAEKENSVGALKVVERMSKLSRLGPDEATALKKLCQWSAVGFKYLMEVINRLEVYETLDVKSSGNAGSITSGERLKMTNLVFNLLGKCEEDFFVSGREKILDKEIGLKDLVKRYQDYKQIEKVYSVLAQLSGFKTKDELMRLYPGKFEESRMKIYVGAEMKGCIWLCFY